MLSDFRTKKKKNQDTFVLLSCTRRNTSLWGFFETWDFSQMIYYIIYYMGGCSVPLTCDHLPAVSSRRQDVCSTSGLKMEVVQEVVGWQPTAKSRWELMTSIVAISPSRQTAICLELTHSSNDTYQHRLLSNPKHCHSM